MEVWKDTKYKGYEVSSLGRVRSNDRYQINSDNIEYHYKSKILKQSNSKGRDGYGYLVVNLRQQGKGNIVLVHRLVADAFLENPMNLPTVNHIDGDKHNNRVDNLEWNSFSENNKHALNNHLRSPRGNRIIQKSLSGEILAEFKSTCEASRITGISRGGISHCINGRTNSSGGFIWEKLKGQSTIENTDVNSGSE